MASSLERMEAREWFDMLFRSVLALSEPADSKPEKLFETRDSLAKVEFDCRGRTVEVGRFAKAL